MSAKKNDQVQPIEKFRDLLREFDDAMLVSTDAQGLLHGRPMRIVARHQDHLDDLWFVTSLESGKATEVREEPRVAVILADGKRFLSISGDARVVVDPAKLQGLWQESWKLWFPEGLEAGGIGLIQVRPLRAEYWDQSMPKGIRFAFEAAKAWIKQEAIKQPEGPEHHAKVRFA